jgi:hypothetical protein
MRKIGEEEDANLRKRGWFGSAMCALLPQLEEWITLLQFWIKSSIFCWQSCIKDAKIL